MSRGKEASLPSSVCRAGADLTLPNESSKSFSSPGLSSLAREVAHFAPARSFARLTAPSARPRRGVDGENCPMRTIVSIVSVSTLVLAAAGCSSPSKPGTGTGTGTGNCNAATATLSAGASSTPLSHRAYIVSRDSDDLTVIDLDKLEIIGNMETCGEGDHMGELNADFSKIYVDSPDRKSVV